MILFIITDSPENSRGSGFWNTKHVLEEHAEDACIVLRYNQVSLDVLKQISPWAICHSGAGATYDTYDVLQHAPYHAVVRECDCAQIGFCGGHQIIAHVFGSTLDHMRTVRDDEPDLGAGYHPGQYKEWGVYPVRIVTRDPLFDELGDVIRVQEYHMDEVKELSPELRLLASSENCRVQAFVHREKPIYGTQFHPEQSNEAYPDGFRILRNFFAIARRHGRGRGPGAGGQ